MALVVVAGPVVQVAERREIGPHARQQHPPAPGVVQPPGTVHRSEFLAGTMARPSRRLERVMERVLREERAERRPGDLLRVRR